MSNIKKKNPRIGDLPKGLEKYEPAVKALQKFLMEQETESPPGTKCNVDCFGSAKEGVRIAEITYSLKTNAGCMGSSYMRCDAAFALSSTCRNFDEEIVVAWPWGEPMKSQESPLRDLVKAGALIVAEIERIQRANDQAEPRRR